MLSRFDGKTIRVTTEDGSVFTGTAQSYPSGYGLHEFGVEEEGLEIGDTAIFLSDIVRIDTLPEMPDIQPAQCDAFTAAMLEQPYMIADILPRQVPKDAKGQCFAVERYWRRPEQLAAIRRKQAQILLRLNCFCDMTVTFDGGENWETNSDPERFAARLSALSRGSFLRALFPAQETMIDIEPDDTRMTVTCLQAAFSALIDQLVRAEGLFLRASED